MRLWFIGLRQFDIFKQQNQQIRILDNLSAAQEKTWRRSVNLLTSSRILSSTHSGKPVQLILGYLDETLVIQSLSILL